MTDHDCPHCAEAQAMASELRTLLPEAHALIARMHRALGDGHHVEATPLPATAAPGTSATVRKSRDHA